jgi:uncharacterized secreted protein with C-terminal beta-propeller domain
MDTTGDGGGTGVEGARYALQPAQDCQTVKSRVIDSTTEQVLTWRYQSGFMAEADAGSSDDRGNNESSSPTDYTTTNTQEANVDEDDIIKTDGEYIYAVRENEFVIIESWPADQTSIVSRTPLGDGNQRNEGWARSLFLKGDTAAVFSQVYNSNEGSNDSFYGTRVTIFDVTDRTNPTVKRKLDIEGWMTQGRMINGDVYLISNSQLQVPQAVWDSAWEDDPRLPERTWDETQAQLEAKVNAARPIIRQKVTAALQNVDVADMMPEKRTYDAQGNQLTRQPLYKCTELYLPHQATEMGVLNVSHFDLDQPDPGIDSTGLLARGWQVYASEDNLYVAMSNRWWWWWGWNATQNESIIHKFNLNGPKDRPVYTATGKVDGWILNQFSMDEHQGNLRVATTDNRWDWNRETGERTDNGGNHVTVLSQSGGTLQEVGSVRDLAPGERIFSVRMMGDKGYVVTFEQVDPLFTLDLSVPSNPRVMGELKINGFSSYIHPLGSDHLMTIGQDADSDGRIQGVHLQIFDVSDMTDPERVFQEKITTGNWSSWSEAMWNHHAFTYHPGRKMLAFPINIYQWDEYSGNNFSGLLVYRADAQNGFNRVGMVNHADLTGQQDRWWTSIRRSTFIEDNVYSFSEVGLKVNDLYDPSTEHAVIQF